MQKTPAKGAGAGWRLWMEHPLNGNKALDAGLNGQGCTLQALEFPIRKLFQCVDGASVLFRQGKHKQGHSVLDKIQRYL